MFNKENDERQKKEIMEHVIRWYEERHGYKPGSIEEALEEQATHLSLLATSGGTVFWIPECERFSTREETEQFYITNGGLK